MTSFGLPFTFALFVCPVVLSYVCLFVLCSVAILECKSDEASLECNALYVCSLFFVCRGGVRFPGDV